MTVAIYSQVANGWWNRALPAEGDTWGGGQWAPAAGGDNQYHAAGSVFRGGKWTNPLTYQAEQLAAKKIGYETENLGLQNQISREALRAQQTSNQVANMAGSRLNELLQDPNSISSDPGYQFQYNQGLEAVNRTAAAKGMLGSGNRLYDLTNYGQDRAKTSYGDAVSRLGSLLGSTLSSAQNQSRDQLNNQYQTNTSGQISLGGKY